MLEAKMEKKGSDEALTQRKALWCVQQIYPCMGFFLELGLHRA